MQKYSFTTSGKRLAVPLFFCFFFSCFLVEAKDAKTMRIKNKSIEEREREASFSDMPLPVGGVVQKAVAGGKNESETDGNKSITYLVASSYEKLAQFYERGMVQLGWHRISHNHGSEDVAVYETPTKIALVIMRPYKPKKGWRSSKYFISLYEMNKEQEAIFD